jgi:hypothetical protein
MKVGLLQDEPYYLLSFKDLGSTSNGPQRTGSMQLGHIDMPIIFSKINGADISYADTRTSLVLQDAVGNLQSYAREQMNHG